MLADGTLEEEVQVKVLFTVPPEFNDIYHKLLIYLVDFGVDLVKDCSAGCNVKNKKIIDCWNMFQSALAAYDLATVKDETDTYYKKAKLFIKYIEGQIDLTYKQEPTNE